MGIGPCRACRVSPSDSCRVQRALLQFTIFCQGSNLRTTCSIGRRDPTSHHHKVQMHRWVTFSSFLPTLVTWKCDHIWVCLCMESHTPTHLLFSVWGKQMIPRGTKKVQSPHNRAHGVIEHHEHGNEYHEWLFSRKGAGLCTPTNRSQFVVSGYFLLPFEDESSCCCFCSIVVAVLCHVVFVCHVGRKTRLRPRCGHRDFLTSSAHILQGSVKTLRGVPNCGQAG